MGRPAWRVGIIRYKLDCCGLPWVAMEETYLWGYQAGEAVCDGAGWEEWVDEREG